MTRTLIKIIWNEFEENEKGRYKERKNKKGEVEKVGQKPHKSQWRKKVIFDVTEVSAVDNVVVVIGFHFLHTIEWNGL